MHYFKSVILVQIQSNLRKRVKFLAFYKITSVPLNWHLVASAPVTQISGLEIQLELSTLDRTNVTNFFSHWEEKNDHISHPSNQLEFFLEK